MIARYNYTNLENVLLALKDQVIDSLTFAREFLPSGSMTANQIFKFLKKEVTYVNDPKGVELLQSMQTMFTTANKHNIYGAGDCDCFTITALACLYVKGFRDIGIVLAGRNHESPVHIYAYVGNTPFDLTNDTLGTERKYTFKQKIPLKL